MQPQRRAGRALELGRMMRWTPALTLTLVMTVALAGSADAASYRSCKIGYYSPDLDEGFPGVARLRIAMRSKLADGYAPRCLVAESVASAVQFRVGENIGEGVEPDGPLSPRIFPRRVRVSGARWSVGIFRCSYRWLHTDESPLIDVQCSHTGKDASRVRFVLAA
jgi:hypothetical protein